MRTIGITRFLSRTIIWTAGIVGVFLLAVFGWFIWGIIQLQDHPIFAGGRTMSLEPIHLEVGDKHLRIPKAYMDYRPNWKGGKQDGAGMQVILPDMKPFGADTIEEFKKPGHANKFRVLINEGGILKKNEATERKIAKTNQCIRGLAKSSKERNFDGLVENNTCFFTKRAQYPTLFKTPTLSTVSEDCLV